MTIGEKIKVLRTEMGLSQHQLAMLLGYSTRSSISKIENDKVSICIADIPRIASTLKTTPEQLLKGMFD